MTSYSGKIIRKTPVTPTQTSASGVWTTADAAAAVKNNLWPVPGVPDPISRSVRLRSSASAYFNRTASSVTSNLKWTYSCWFKRGTLGAVNYLLSGGDSTYRTALNIDTNNTIQFFHYNSSTYPFLASSSAVFRDPSAWYHIVFVFDCTQATSSNGLKLYVNGVQQTLSISNYTQNNGSTINNTGYPNWIGWLTTTGSYADGYLTEVNFIDGQALTPSSFGTTNAFTGAWIPMPYTGTYGANGFYLNFKDNTSTTTLGYDYSGNANNWASNNISLTAGTTYDSMLDSPTSWVGYSATTDTSAVTRGNYCVLNGANNGYGTTTLSQGNLYVVISAPGATEGMAVGTVGMTTGKWYWEVNVVSVNTTYSYPCSIGIGNLSTTTGVGMPATSYAYNSKDGNKLSSTGSFVSAAYGASYTANDVIGVAFDADAGTLTFYKNNTSQGTAFTGIASSTWFPRVGSNDGCTLAFNFGQRPFTYTPPTGYKTLCTTNLSTPTIVNGASYMAATTYTGNGANRSISNAVNGVSFQPDFVWVKNRTNAYDHNTYDSLRPQGSRLITNLTSAEGGTTTVQVNSFNSDGFGLGTYIGVNESGSAFVGWQWKAGGSAVSNTSGTITSQVSVNTTAGFSIATYTGTGSNATVGHGLGAAPSMVIVKLRSGAGENWNVWHTSLGSNTYRILLNTTGAVDTTSPTVWSSGGINPTSTTFTVGTSTGTNGSASTYVAYCFAAVAGYSAFGSYTGNGSSDGPFVYCGFRPRFVMVKRTDTTGSWYIEDSSRNTYNATGLDLYANLSSAEANDAPVYDFTANGFKLRNTYVDFNASGGTYIYAAFAENPFKYSNAR